MKIKNLTFILLLSVILLGLMVAGYVFVQDEEETSGSGNQNQAQAAENYTVASISKGTILFLLAVGVVGVLGVSRKKKDIFSSPQKNEPNSLSGHQSLNAGRQESVVKKP